MKAAVTPACKRLICKLFELMRLVKSLTYKEAEGIYILKRNILA